VVVVLVLMSLILIPSLGRARESANRIKCASGLRQIGQAAMFYANDHGGQLPADLPTLLETQDITAEVFTCPSSEVDTATGPTTQQIVASLLAGDHLSYAWTGAGLTTTTAPADAVLAFDLERHVPKDNVKTTGFNVLLFDGSVTFVNEATGKAIWAQFVSGVRPIRLSVHATSVTTLPASAP
jgi:competence protein ComGC